MKKFYLLLTAALCGLLSASAQTNQVIWMNGRAVVGQSIGQVDSIKYGTMEGVDTLRLVLPRTVVLHDTDVNETNRNEVIKVVRDTVIKEVIKIVHDTVYVNTSGEVFANTFSISAIDKQKRLFSGNLLYGLKSQYL